MNGIINGPVSLDPNIYKRIEIILQICKFTIQPIFFQNWQPVPFTKECT